jgi:hypothetical protein
MIIILITSQILIILQVIQYIGLRHGYYLLLFVTSYIKQASKKNQSQ